MGAEGCGFKSHRPDQLLLHWQGLAVPQESIREQMLSHAVLGAERKEQMRRCEIKAKTRHFLTYEVVVTIVEERFDKEMGEWDERGAEFSDKIYEECFAFVPLTEEMPDLNPVERDSELNLAEKVLDLAKACARGYLEGMKVPKWEVPE